MKLFGLEGKGLLISVGITIIMCGAVTYYCHMRVKNVEVALMKQNQVLSSFITNVQGEIRKGGLSDTRSDVSSPEARNAVKNLENSKIEVSDDSASEDEDEDETDDDASDSASASETESESESETDDETVDNKNSTIKDIKIVDIQTGLLNEFTSNNKIIELTDLEEITDFANLREETDDDSDDDSISDVESISAISIEPEFKKINLSEIIVEHKQEPVVNSVNVEEVDVVASADVHTGAGAGADADDFIKKIVKTEDKEKTSNINKMKIDELREKVILSGLGTVESVKKLKKSDLITLLTENK